MKRYLLMALLAAGTIAGYGAGFASLACHHAGRSAFERHLADLCSGTALHDPRPESPLSR